DRLKTTDEDRVRVDADAALDRAERVVVGGDGAPGLRSRARHARAPDAKRRLERCPELGIVVRRDVEIDRLGDDPDALGIESHSAVGDRERVERGMQRAFTLGTAVRRLDGQVRELAVANDGPDPWAVEVDLIDGELAGEEREEAWAEGHPVAVDGVTPAVGRLDAHAIELDGEGPDAERRGVRRHDAL